MDRKTIYYTLSVPMGGFLSGFDAVVISGINLKVRICLSIIDKRHSTLIGYVISLLMMGFGFFGQDSPIVNLFGILTFFLAYDSGHGTVVRLVTSEILPNKPSVEAKSIGAEILGVGAVITLPGMSMISPLVPSWKIFPICLSCMILQLLFVLSTPGISSRSLKCVQKDKTQPIYI